MTKPNCYECIHRRDIPGDAHSQCAHPALTMTDRIMSVSAIASGTRSNAMNRLNISGSATGVKGGWFMWPMNFDPRWLESCNGFERKEVSESATKTEQL